jgi:hypothetical protein
LLETATRREYYPDVRSRITLLALLWFSAAGCSSETAILLTIQSGLRVPEELDALNITVARDAKQLMDRTYAIESQEDLPATLRIIAENDAEATVHIVVAGLKGSEPVAQGETDATFVRGETVEVTVFLREPGPGGEDGGYLPADAGQDAGRDASVDTGPDAGVDATPDAAGDSGADGEDDGGSDIGSGQDSELDAGSDATDAGADTGIPDVPQVDDAGADAETDAGTDAGTRDEGTTDDVGADTAADAGADGGPWIGQPCTSDGDCGGGMFCLAVAAGHGFCSARCEDAGCGADAQCVDLTPLDAGSLCARSCTRHTDCLRKDFGCNDPLDAGTAFCSPNFGPGNTVLEYPRVAVSPEFYNPAVTDDAFQLVAAMYDEEHAVFPGETFSWMSSDMTVVKPVTPSPGVFEPLEAGTSQITALSIPHGLEGCATIEVEAVVETLAGSGASGDQDGEGRDASFNSIEHIVVDRVGNAFVTDRRLAGYLPTIRKIDPSGVVTTIAVPTSHPACLDGPLTGPVGWGVITGMTIDQVTGDIYFSDAECNGVRKLSQDAVSTVFKTEKGFANGGPGVGKVDSPGVLEFGLNAIIFFDTNNRRVRSVSVPDLEITTLAGSGVQGYKDGLAAEAEFDDVRGLDAIPGGAVFVTDFASHVVRRIEAGTVSTIAGTGVAGMANGSAAEAQFDGPRGVFYFLDQWFIVDRNNDMIRRLDGGRVSTLACLLQYPPLTDGKSSVCSLFEPSGVFLQSAGVLVVADTSNNAIRTLRYVK